LEQAGKVLETEAISMNTWKAYNAALERYCKFCAKQGVPPFEGPKGVRVLRWGRGDGQHLVEHSMFLWLTSLGLEEDIQWATVNNYYTAMRRYELDHGTMGLPLRSRKFKSLTEGIKRRKGTASRANKELVHTRLPFTMELLWKIEQKCMSDQKPRSYEDRLFLAAAATGIGGLLRPSEFLCVGPTQRVEAKLLIGDLKFYSSLGSEQELSILHAVRNISKVHHCILRLKCSKTDQGKLGADVMLANKVVEVLLDYLRSHPNTSNRNNMLFVHRDNSNLTKNELVAKMRHHLRTLGMSEDRIKRFKGQSFRKGGAQSIENAPSKNKDADLEPANQSAVMKLMGRWKSDAHRFYHSMDKNKYAAASLLGKGHTSN
jgi:hypothetical protein